MFVSHPFMKVHCVAFNPVGYGMIENIPSPIRKFPGLPELDFSGVVVDVGNCKEYIVGDGELRFSFLE